MAEAMALGKPVIATAYSGNTEFMTSENSYLCSYEYCEVGKGSEPYLASSRWANPDLDEAARFMREVYEAQDEAKARGLRAADDIRSLHSAIVAGGAISDRICAIRRRRDQFGKIPSIEIFEERLQALEATQPKRSHGYLEKTLYGLCSWNIGSPNSENLLIMWPRLAVAFKTKSKT